MKLRDIRAGWRYEGPDGEVRHVVRIWNQYGGVVQLDWASNVRQRNGKPGIGRTTPQLFARWAVRFAEAEDVQGEGARGDAGGEDQAEACPQTKHSMGSSCGPSNAANHGNEN